MHTPEMSAELTRHDEQHLPLALPEELWSSLSPGQKSLYRRADALLGVLEPSHRALPIGTLLENGPRGEVLRALEMLEGMDLVRLEADDEGMPSVRLVAVPADHVSIVGPDGRRRWVFIARPVDPPDVEPSQLN